MASHPTRSTTARTSHRGKKRQKVDAEVDLRLEDPIIDRDAKILASLRAAVRSNIATPAGHMLPQEQPTLYIKYRGKGFPLRQPNGRRLPAWRNLTPWAKSQIATIVLSEKGWLPFKVHVHDDLWHIWTRDGRHKRDELRNRIARRLKDRFGHDAPAFFFVLEDRTTTGEKTRPHAHGCIGRVRAPVPPRGEGSRKFALMAREQGLPQAEFEAGRNAIRGALWRAAGGRVPAIAETSGVDQRRNVWLPKQPYHPVFNNQYVDYAFRNTRRLSKNLGDRRFAMTNPLRGESRRLWTLIKEGEKALDQWDSD